VTFPCISRYTAYIFLIVNTFFRLTDDSISGPLYDNDGQMEVQSADREIALGLSNHAWIEPASSVQKMPCRLQNEQSRGTCIAPDLDGMEVESPPDLDLSRRLAEPASFLTSGKSSKNRS
jgi:hypothetical protein